MPARNPIDEKSIKRLIALVEEMGDAKIVLSPSPLDITMIRRVEWHAQKQGRKPSGLWYGCGDDWLRFIKSESYAASWLLEYDYAYRLHITSYRRILKIDTLAKIKKFTATYGRNDDSIDWQEVARKYGGIEICPYLGKYRDTGWYYVWDVASGCVWDPTTIAGIEEIWRSDAVKKNPINNPPRLPPKSEWLKQYELKQQQAFQARSAQEGRDWGPKGDWAFQTEKSVRQALAASDRDIARALKRDPGAVRSSYSPEGKAQDWTSPDWRAVLVGTESGIGDPYQDERVHEAFGQAVEKLNADPFYKGAFVWGWESINPAVHEFRMAPVDLKGNPRRNPIPMLGNPAKQNPWEVRSDSGLEGVFADEDDARFYAEEIRGSGALGVVVETRKRQPHPRLQAQAQNPSSRLFSGVYPTGIVYADKARERDGDYLRVAFLPFSTLQLEWSPGSHPAELRAEIERDAAAIIAERGQQYPVDASGHTVRLGNEDGKRNPAWPGWTKLRGRWTRDLGGSGPWSVTWTERSEHDEHGIRDVPVIHRFDNKDQADSYADKVRAKKQGWGVVGYADTGSVRVR